MKHKVLLTIGLFLAIAGTASATFDFSAVCSSGQTLYYKINGNEAMVTFPANAFFREGWTGFTKPSGALVIPDTVRHDGQDYAVTSIEMGTFVFCNDITAITIPHTITSIGAHAFGFCGAIARVDYTGDLGSWCNIHFAEVEANPLYYGHHLYIGTNEVTNLIVPSSVTTVGNSAFVNCTGLTSVTFGSSVTAIDSNAFSGCSNLASVTIPNTVSTIATGAFCQCTNLTSVVLPNTLTSISDEVFRGCTSLASVAIPNTVTSIGGGAFSDCHDIFCLIVPNTVTSIDLYAFSNVQNIIYSGTATGAPWGALHMNGFMEGDLVYADSSRSNVIGCNLTATSVTIPSTVTTISDRAFQYCRNLTSIAIPNSVTSIGDYAFDHCSSLTNATIGNGVTSIGREAFQNCSSLANATIGNGVTSIGQKAFQNCSSLASVTIGGPVAEIGPWAFWGCNSLARMDYTGNIADWCGITFISPTSNPLYLAHHFYMDSSEVTNLVIPDSVTTIGRYAFLGGIGFTSVTLGDSLTHICDSAFAGCLGLGSVTIPNSVTRIDGNAFCLVRNIVYYGPATGSPWGALSMNGFVDGWLVYADSTRMFVRACSIEATNIVLPNTVTEIGDDAFRSCRNLSEATLGYGVTRIGNRAFNDCKGLGYIRMTNYPPEIAIDAFDFEEMHTDLPLLIPCGTRDDYMNAPYWQYFIDITEEHCDFTITATSADEAMGSVTGSGTYPNGFTAILRATPLPGYAFYQWDDGSSDNPREVTVTGDAGYVATFIATNGITGAEDQTFRISNEGRELVVSGAANSTIRVYDMMGRLVSSCQKAEENCRLSVPAAGIYIVQVGNKKGKASAAF